MGRYEDEVAQLVGWFENRLRGRPSFQMTEEDHRSGTDALPEDLASLVKEAFGHWLKTRKYELSYNQLCRAFFVAAKASGKITLVSKHPVFRLGTLVFIKESVARETGEKLYNLPAVITSVRGEEHVVTGVVGVGDAAAHCWCVVLKTDELEENLSLRDG